MFLLIESLYQYTNISVRSKVWPYFNCLSKENSISFGGKWQKADNLQYCIHGIQYSNKNV